MRQVQHSTVTVTDPAGSGPHPRRRRRRHCDDCHHCCCRLQSHQSKNDHSDCRAAAAAMTTVVVQLSSPAIRFLLLRRAQPQAVSFVSTYSPGSSAHRRTFSAQRPAGPSSTHDWPLTPSAPARLTCLRAGHSVHSAFPASALTFHPAFAATQQIALAAKSIWPAERVHSPQTERKQASSQIE